MVTNGGGTANVSPLVCAWLPSRRIAFARGTAVRLRVAKKVFNVHAWAVGTYRWTTLLAARSRLFQVYRRSPPRSRWLQSSSRLDRINLRRYERISRRERLTRW